jgi:hypothetical protein
MANVKISALPAATAATGTDVVPLVQGSTTKKLSMSALLASPTLFGANVAAWLANPTSANLAAAVTDETGSGALVFAVSPSFTTPSLGAATALTINRITFTQPAAGATLTIADGKTLTANRTLTLTGTDGKTLTINHSITLAGTDGTVMTFPSTNATMARTDAAQTFAGTQTFSGSVVPAATLADSVGYVGIPVNSQSAAYGLLATDAGKSIVHPITDNNARTFTIPANGTVPFPVGTTITFINMINTVTIAITTDTMYLAGAGTTGSRTLAAYGMATAVKVTSTSWIISGNGLT